VRAPLRLVPSPQNNDEVALVRAAQAGDSAAQAALFLAAAPELTRFVRRIVLGTTDVDDVVQDTFVAAFEQLKKLRSPEVFRGWLRHIALRLVRKRFRRQRLLRRLGFDDDPGDAPEKVISSQAPPEVRAELSRVAEVLRELPAETALCLSLRRVEGCTVDEIAEQLDLSRSTVKRRLAEAEALFEQRWGSNE
jgi:RNA polymerase sigma-70 factor, ECF subfamily